tara:strand:+ start:216 stop:428 length:213 start_codon:yes stop_codon:yes gene_type:complete
MIKAHINELEGYAQQQRVNLDKIFNDIRHKILEREQLLKKKVSDSLESEQKLMKTKISDLLLHIKRVNDL